MYSTYEISILSYKKVIGSQTQQDKLFPILAAVYSLLFCGQMVHYSDKGYYVSESKNRRKLIKRNCSVLLMQIVHYSDKGL